MAPSSPSSSTPTSPLPGRGGTTESGATQSASTRQQTATSHANTGYGDWAAEVDSSFPQRMDQVVDGQSAGGPSKWSSNGASDAGKAVDDSTSHVHGEEHLRWSRDKPWYRRPDEKWLRPFAFLFALASGMIMGPKVELYLSLICEELGISSGSYTDLLFPSPSQRPPISTQCRQSGSAQAAQTSLQLKVTIVMGLLSAITTGFWGGLSDRKGRIFVLRFAMFGLLINDLVFITAGHFPQDVLPFKNNFLVVGAAVEGCLGGFATLTACHQAYISDVTPSGTKAKIFSFFTGILFLGFAVGPSLGGWLSKHTSSLMSPFYFALGAHLFYLLFTLIGLPESLSPEKQERANDEYEKKWQEASETARGQSVRRNITSFLLVPVQPLALFLPHRRHDKKAESEEQDQANLSHISVSHTRTQKLDWNMTLLTLAYFIETSCAGIITPKINYAQYKFDWGVQDVGYYISFVSTSRVICLVLFIPLFIKWWHKPPVSIALPQDGRESDSGRIDESQSLLDDQGRSRERQYGSTEEAAAEMASSRLDTPSPEEVERLWTLRSHHLRQLHDSAFDKRVALLSICINASCMLLLAISRNMGPAPFLAYSALTGLGGAAPAAISSLALALLEKDSDAGKFFAACAVLLAIGATIVGPVMFMELFKSTVSWAPESIFILAFVMFIVAAIVLSFVQVRRPASLPSLPARSYPPSPRTEPQQQGEDDTVGPMNSTRSKIRMRPTNPFGKS